MKLTTTQEAEQNIRELLVFLKQDIDREGLKETPLRYLKAMREFLTPPDWKATTFDSEGMDEMIIVKDIHFYSLCEHHLAPFIGTGAIAYIPNEKIIGISKLPRTLETFSRRLQNQERITSQVAEYLQELLKPKGVAVLLQAQHHCMTIRGVKKHQAVTITSKMTGCFKSDPICRNEFLSLISK